MSGLDRGDALLQCALFVFAVMVVFWSCVMDHADDGLPPDDPYPKWWKRSQEKTYNLGHAARIDPGVALAGRPLEEVAGEPAVG